jgi:hypothetical protein
MTGPLPASSMHSYTWIKSRDFAESLKVFRLQTTFLATAATIKTLQPESVRKPIHFPVLAERDVMLGGSFRIEKQTQCSSKGAKS